jgi:phosphoglycolate phosphatase
MEHLALFDIDCTLIDGHGLGGRAVMRAIKEVFGVEGELGDYSFHGRTDPGIVRDLVELWSTGDPDALVGAREGETQPRVVRDLAAEWGASDEIIDRMVDDCIARYLELLPEEVTEGRIEVLPGVKELVPALAVDGRVLLGLLTGNVEGGARIKLAATGFASLFKVAVYGSDSAWRSDLPALAVRRAEELTGRRFRGKEIVIIGDSPADIECGAGLGVKTIAVATGRHSTDELAAHALDYLFTDMSDWRGVSAAILA